MPKSQKKVIALDSEFMGLDLYHLSKPFLVQLFDGENEPYCWEWEVDPKTRQPSIPESDKDEIRDWLERADLIVGQNVKIDIQAIATIGIEYPQHYYQKTHDTLFASHIIASAQKHDLTTLAMKMLRVDIQPLEDAVEKAVKEARKIARRDYKDWMIAKHGLPGMPSVKKSSDDKEEKIWKNDMWLPKEIARAKKYPSKHPWWTVTREYGVADPVVTWYIFEQQMQMLEEMDLAT